MERLPEGWNLGPFLRVPPFPGAKVQTLTGTQNLDSYTDALERVRQLRVGGAFWAVQPGLPEEYVLARSATAASAAKRLNTNLPILCWADGDHGDLSGECDPWHMLAGARMLVTERRDEVALIAAVLRVPVYHCDPQSDELTLQDIDPRFLLGQALSMGGYVNPFTGQPMSATDAIELCGFWRELIDANRDITAGVGFAFWKQQNVAPLLWGGNANFSFSRVKSASGPVAVWRAKASPTAIAELERQHVPLIEVEDGFLRSQGLGADCIPPLSITVDRLGAYFDPAKPSELELLLQEGKFDEALLARARELRDRIVVNELGKYERGGKQIDRPAGSRRHILVPGQVEDDRAVQSGGCGLVSNLELLRKVREQAPDAYILYKPHPDVLAGHRRGAATTQDCLIYADEVVSGLPITSLIVMVDEVHVNTSLAGFEALLRCKSVTTYGVPFYSGWGLTRDLGPVPARRSARRTLDELVAATLLIYPRYLDPRSGLPCPAEVVVTRLCETEGEDPGLIVGIRRLQGKVMRHLRSFVQ